MKNKKYLQALKVLEDLEHNYLNQLQKYRFAHFLTQSIGPLRDDIRGKSYSELTDFLENLRTVSRRIGEDASKHVCFYLCTLFKLNLRLPKSRKSLAELTTPQKQIWKLRSRQIRKAFNCRRMDLCWRNWREKANLLQPHPNQNLCLKKTRSVLRIWSTLDQCTDVARYSMF